MENKSIHQQLAEVSLLIGKVEKGGTNQHFKFKYQAWDDVLPAVRGACAQVGIWIIPTIENVERGEKNVEVNLTFRITNGKEEIVCGWTGEALGNDDKAIQKAATSATKYFFLKTFLIPVKDDVDPDAEAGVPQAPNKPAAEEPVNWKARINAVLTPDQWKEFSELCKERGQKPAPFFEQVWNSPGNGDRTSAELVFAAIGEIATVEEAKKIVGAKA